MKRLDSIIESEKIERVDLIKCDDESGEKLGKIFDPLDYRYFSIDDVRGTIRPVTRLRKSDHFNVLVCRQESAEFLQADRTLPWV